MPAQVRRLLVYAAVDGLILQPSSPNGLGTGRSLKIQYQSHLIVHSLADINVPEGEDLDAIESHGIIGANLTECYA